MPTEMPTDAEIAALILRGKRMRAEALRAMFTSVWTATVEMFRIPAAYRQI